jgi:hypothetical protein
MKKFITTAIVALAFAAASKAALIDVGEIDQPSKQKGNPHAQAATIIAADLTGIGTDPLIYLAKAGFGTGDDGGQSGAVSSSKLEHQPPLGHRPNL